MTAPQTTTDQLRSAATDAGGQVAGTTKEQAGEVASTVKEQTSAVVGEGLEQAKSLAGDVRETVQQQVQTQSERMTEQLRTLSNQLKDGDTSGVVGQLLTEAGSRLQALADKLGNGGPEGLLSDARDYARRNPGSFLLGAAAAGLVTGRLVKAAGSSSGSSPGTPAVQGNPPAGTPGIDPYPAPLTGGAL